MSHTKPLDHGKRFERNGGSVQMVKQSYTSAEQDGCHIDLDFIQQPCIETLLGNTGANQIYILIPGSFPGLADGAFHTVCDEGERRPGLDPFLRNCVGHDKMRLVCSARGIASPPVRDIKCPSACD